MATSSIGVDIGGTKCLGVRLEHGVVRAEHRLPTPRTGEELVATIAEVVTVLGPADAVGVGAPGLVDGAGVLRFAPNLPGVVEFPLRARLAASLGIDPAVDNDATCAVWAETTSGAAAGSGEVVMVTIGTGIGGGLVAEGRIRRGRNGFAGEIGHMVVDPNGPACPCGQRGCWERYASGSGLGWMGREAALAAPGGRMAALAGGDPEAVRGEHVTVAAREGDRAAAEVLERFAWWLGLGLANLANALDPEVIVLGGGMIESGATVVEPARAAFSRLVEGVAHRPPISVVAAALGERAGAIGAALLAGA